MPVGGRLTKDQVANGLSRTAQFPLACKPLAPGRLEVFAALGKAVKAELTRIAAESSGAAVLVKVAKRLFAVRNTHSTQGFVPVVFESH